MGMSRDKNEDSCLHCELDNGWDLLIVADGMGGHNAGEVASKIAVKSIAGHIQKNIRYGISYNEAAELIKDAVLAANRDIYAESRNNIVYSGMGTTVTIAMVNKSTVLIGHVGDSRAYMLKDGKLKRITNDHSLVAEMVKSGTITELEAQNHPQKNIITRALGTSESVEVDIEAISIGDNDTIVLCTDGLSNMICDSKIEEILLNNEDVQAAAKELISLANKLGGYDNITVVIGKKACPDSEVRQ